MKRKIAQFANPHNELAERHNLNANPTIRPSRKTTMKVDQSVSSPFLLVTFW